DELVRVVEQEHLAVAGEEDRDLLLGLLILVVELVLVELVLVLVELVLVTLVGVDVLLVVGVLVLVLARAATPPGDGCRGGIEVVRVLVRPLGRGWAGYLGGGPVGAQGVADPAGKGDLDGLDLDLRP